MQAGTKSHQIVIVGGGGAGIAVAAELARRNMATDLALIEPREIHNGRALWPLVGAGVYDLETTRRRISEIAPDGVTWIHDAVSTIDADNSKLELESGEPIGYEFLVVCAGVESTWDGVAGLGDTLGTNGVCSVYTPEQAAYTWEVLKVLESGRALFALPESPVRCAASTFELMFLAADNLDQRGRLDRTEVGLYAEDKAVDFNPLINGPLQEVYSRYGIQVHRGCRLVEVDGASRTAVFESTRGDLQPERFDRRFDLLHVVPGRKPPSVVAASGLAGPTGWLDVDSATLRHSAHRNVFGAGDVIGGTFLRSIFGLVDHARVVGANLSDAVRGAEPGSKCDGRETVVLSTGYNRAIRLRFNEPIGSARKTEVSAGADGLLTYWKHKRSLPRKYWSELLKGRS